MDNAMKIIKVENELIKPLLCDIFDGMSRRKYK